MARKFGELFITLKVEPEVQYARDRWPLAEEDKVVEMCNPFSDSRRREYRIPADPKEGRDRI